MTYYTNSNQIKDLMTSLTRLEVMDLGALESLSGVSVLLFDALFSICLPDHTLRTECLMRLRPDWMGTILELMRKNEEVYLHWGEEWCRVLYREDAHFGFPSQSDASGVYSTRERQRKTPTQTVCETEDNCFQSLYGSRKPI